MSPQGALQIFLEGMRDRSRFDENPTDGIFANLQNFAGNFTIPTIQRHQKIFPGFKSRVLRERQRENEIIKRLENTIDGFIKRTDVAFLILPLGHKKKSPKPNAQRRASKTLILTLTPICFRFFKSLCLLEAFRRS